MVYGMEQKPKRLRRRDTLEMMLMPTPTNRSGAALYRYVHFKHVIPKCNSETAIIPRYQETQREEFRLLPCVLR